MVVVDSVRRGAESNAGESRSAHRIVLTAIDEGRASCAGAVGPHAMGAMGATQCVALCGGLDLCFGRYDYAWHPSSDLPVVAGGSNACMDAVAVADDAVTTSPSTTETVAYGTVTTPPRDWVGVSPRAILKGLPRRFVLFAAPPSTDPTKGALAVPNPSVPPPLQGHPVPLEPTPARSNGQPSGHAGEGAVTPPANATPATGQTAMANDGRPESVMGPVFPGKDYSNPFVRDFFRLAEFQKDSVDRTTVPRMPWHDVGVGVTGQAARDLAWHFVQRWNFVKVDKGMCRPRVSVIAMTPSADHRPFLSASTPHPARACLGGPRSSQNRAGHTLPGASG